MSELIAATFDNFNFCLVLPDFHCVDIVNEDFTIGVVCRDVTPSLTHGFEITRAVLYIGLQLPNESLDPSYKSPR